MRQVQCDNNHEVGVEGGTENNARVQKLEYCEIRINMDTLASSNTLSTF